MKRLTWLVALLVLIGVPVLAQDGSTTDPPAEAQQESNGPKIDWVPGPGTGSLGEHAVIKIPEDFVFADGEGTRRFLTATQNQSSGREVGMLLTAREQGARYFVIFEFDEIGYVKEDDKDELDGDALLESLREGTEAGNEFRREHGWGEIEVVGWERAPFYDQRTNNLTWATKVRGKGADGGESINWSTRLLGRRGVMNVDLVLAPEDLTVALGEFETSLGGFEFSPGHRYREWATGDKVAAVGLGALVLGGAGAIAAKTGLLAKFWKLILAAGKWIVIGLVAIGAGLRKLFSGKRGESETGPPPSPPPPPPIPTT